MCENNQFLFLIFLFGICCIKTNSVLGASQSQNDSEYINRNQCFIENNDTLTCNYIPTSVPKGISRVQITDFLIEHRRLEVKTSDFEADSWGYVTHLTMTDDLNTDETMLEFTARSFNNLKSLRKLAMHIVPNFLLDPKTFLGLGNVTTLDMGQCAWLGLDTLASALDSDDILPLLETLIISQISYKKGPLNLDLTGYHKLANKTNFKVIEISSTQFSMINPYPLSDFKYLEVINLSYSHLLEMSTTLPDVGSITHIKLSDIAYVVLPMLDIIIPPKVENKHFDLDPLELVSFIFAPRIVNVSGILQTRNPIWVKNCTATFTADWNVHVQEIIAKKNNVTYADLDLDCKGFGITSLLSLDISQNSLQFVHPNFLCFVPNITRINLSQNKLSVMAEVNLPLFQNLFNGLPNLQDIILSANELYFIPRNMFKENTNVELIDISNNLLNQITFELSHARKLQTLLLHNNQIQILDSASITDLMNIPQMSPPQRNQTNLTVTLYGNPLSCAQCETKQYLRWLISTGLVGNKYLRCYSDEGTRDINGFVLNYVENICRRQLTIISSCLSAGFILLVLAISLFKIYKRYRNAKKTKNYEKALHLLEKGQNHYEFAVFLSYSSLDDDFVKHSVIEQLEESLKETSGIDRTLICEGDLVLRPGFHVLDETIHCIQRSSVVIVVVSDHFCQSPYCHTELYQAYDLKKPILLILKDKVDENIMSPVMKLLFKRNVRVLFENINGEYVLKTTWENVCKSIIDLIADQI